jgi:TonB-dependent receptor
MNNPVSVLLPRWQKIVALAACWLATLVPSFAENAGTGSLQGRVYNPLSREYINNAEVRLEGTNQVTYTESDGSFRFAQIAPGEATIAVSYAGYNSVRETVRVTAGQIAVREINLTSTATGAAKGDGVVQLGSFSVSAEREGNSKAIMAQRRNMDISTSVSSDIFGDVADGNVGEFLKYLPGVDLDYVESLARGPRMGGMDSQYVGVAFDGMRIASSDSVRGGDENSRSASFEGFAITAVDSIEISRTTSAESDSDSPAGTINMKTKRAFDRKGRVFSYTTGVNFNAEEFTANATQGPSDSKHLKWKPNLSFEYAESFLQQRLGVLVSVSTANSYTEQYDITLDYNRVPTAADPRQMVVRQINFKDGPKFMEKQSILLTADFKATRNLVLSLNVIYSYAGGEFHNRNFTFIAANNNANVNNGRSRVGGDGLLTVSTNRATNNTVPTLNNGGGSSTEITYTRTVTPKFEYKTGAWVVDGAAGYSQAANNFDSLERGYLQSEGGGVASNWTATRPHPGSWEWTIRQTSGADWYNLANFTSTDVRSGGAQVSNNDPFWVTEIWTGQLNAKWALPFKRWPVSLKFGGKWAEESRQNNNHTPWNIWSYVGPGGNTVTVNPNTQVYQNATFGNWANVGPDYTSPHPFDMGTTNGLTVYNIAGIQGMPPRVNRNLVADHFHTRPEQFVHTGTPENFYTAFVANKRDFRQTVTAGYSQADVRLTPKLQFRFGVRMEETRNDLREFDPRLRAQVLAAGYTVNAPGTNGGRALTVPGIIYQFMSQPRITRSSTYRNFFPSALLKYQILPNFEFQAGFNKAISRPPVNSLTGLWTVDEVNQRVTAPNANLEPEYSKNAQARLAYYFGGRSPGQLSLAMSQNEIRNLRETFDYSASEYGNDDPDFSAFTFRSTRNSAEQRRFRNMELAYNQTLGFLPSEKLRGINVNVAYTRSYASQRRNGLSPHRLTSRLGYNYRKFSATLGMVFRDDSADGAYGLYKGAITQFDCTLGWRFSRSLSLYVQGRNITNVPVLWYASPTNSVEGENAAFRRLQAYGANWVFGVKGIF